MLEVAIRHKQGDFSLDASFSAGSGLTAMIGPSGSGKTTLANMVAGLIRPDHGVIRFGETVWCDSGKNICLPPSARRIGYVFQDARLFPHLTVQQNLDYARRFRNVASTAADDRRLVELLGIGHLLTRRPAALSGGEKSRVAIGRALFSAPDLLVMDEPLSALDSARKAEILPHLEYIRDETGIPVLYVSHAMEEVARLATHVVSVQQGKVAAQGTTAEVLGATMALPQDMEPGSFIEATIVKHLDNEGLTLAASRVGEIYLKRCTDAPGSRIRLHIPASDIIISTEDPHGLSTLNRLQGHISALNPVGLSVYVSVNCGGEIVLAQVTQRSASLLGLKVGQSVHLLFKSVSLDMQGLFHQA